MNWRRLLIRVTCLLIGHSRNMRMEFELKRNEAPLDFTAYCARCAWSNNSTQLDFTAYCARCDKPMPKRIVAACFTIASIPPNRYINGKRKRR